MLNKESVEVFESCLNYFIFQDLDDIFDLYKIYSAHAISSPDEIRSSIDDFCQYLVSNIDLVKRKEGISKEGFIKSLGHFKRSITNTINRYWSVDYLNFTKMVYEVSPSKKNEKLLEVGAGKIPSTSIWLAQNMSQVVSIDSSFYLSKQSLKNLGVISHEKLFNEYSQIGDSSFVIGRCPCSAIKHMVKKCAEQNIPYFIKLCDCDIVSSMRVMPNPLGWVNILTDYDPNIKFYKDFAYNLDISKEQISQVVEKYDSRIPFRGKNVKIVRYYDRGVLLKEEEMNL